ncbi:MAG: aldo/keto reductase [Deltaproteobacteria bacterium]|jgi:aryl-alcohol dehydrogenase-like predicted oxidoreductase|nr:aldo/keto reductase [Deltaproteobacteria bacterium]
MEYVKLGRSGLEVSRICLGCLSYGQTPASLKLWPWTLSEEQGRAFIKSALEKGINFFDTANTYAYGESEKVLGRALRDFSRRDDVVIATKVGLVNRPGPNGSGLSRKAIFDELDKSLRNLGTDYIDLYIMHRFDYSTPLEETLEALNDAVRAGKVRYIGASSTLAWQLMKAIGMQRANGWASFVSMQNLYNLIYREEDREMLPLCLSEGVAVTPWSPLARGRLTRPWSDEAATERGKSDKIGQDLFKKTRDLDKPLVDRLEQVATDLGRPMAQVALAWTLRNPAITAPVIGATKPQHLEDAVSAVDLKLSEADAARLDELYEPHPQSEAFAQRH